MPEFDLHVATEPMKSSALEEELLLMGLTHDLLLDRHVDFHGNTAVSACPLIGLHMTKKYPTLAPSEAKTILKADLSRVHELLIKHGAIGYAHGEVTNDGYDTTVPDSFAKKSIVSRLSDWPVIKFEPARTSEEKKWDLHIAIPLSILTADLKAVLAESGMYSIDLEKTRNGRQEIFRIYTIQGTSSPTDGMRLFDVLKQWFQENSLARIEMKQETYVGMVRVGEPLIVPPTVNKVEFKTRAAVGVGIHNFPRIPALQLSS